MRIIMVSLLCRLHTEPLYLFNFVRNVSYLFFCYVDLVYPDAAKLWMAKLFPL